MTDAIHSHGQGGYRRGCRCEVCRGAVAEYHRRREGYLRRLGARQTGQSRGPVINSQEAAESSLDRLEARQSEALELHEERLRAAYAALVARTPAGFRPATWDCFLLTQGDLSLLNEQSRLV